MLAAAAMLTIFLLSTAACSASKAVTFSESHWRTLHSLLTGRGTLPDSTASSSCSNLHMHTSTVC
jgi:hypothetical protein